MVDIAFELTARDVFIPLDGRVDRAQQKGAALFVSMHADALADHSVRGASVYTLAQTASDAQTAALARTENSADRFIGNQWRDASPQVAQILASLVRRETRAGSVQIARSMVGSLDQDLPMLPNPDRHAGFVVLKAADIPSVLVEMGFMSNPRDEAALRQPEHRKLVAQAMQRAVDVAFFSRPCAHSRYAFAGDNVYARLRVGTGRDCHFRRRWAWSARGSGTDSRRLVTTPRACGENQTAATTNLASGSFVQKALISRAEADWTI